MMKRQFATALILCALFVSASASSKEPDWSGTIIARGMQRDVIESTDILVRPYRPLHFYGNTLRRQYYRGSAVPTVRDVVRGTTALVGRR